MNRQDALEKAIHYSKVYHSICDDAEGFWAAVIEALSQEPCDDAVSRDAVREILSNARLGESKLAYELDKLPSVTQKSGKWINKDFRKEEFVLAGKCTVCGQMRVIDKFCSHCGAKMESEVNNG